MLNALLAFLTVTHFACASSPQDDKRATARATIQEIGNALDMFYSDCGRYPFTHEGLTPLMKPQPWCGKKWGPNPYLKRISLDPWGHPYIYQGDGKSYKLQSLGADGKEGGSGENMDLISGGS